MQITHLSLTNFRNYGRLELPLPAGATLFYGDNAQGKTNLLEAIYYLATTRSPYADYDQQLINWEVDTEDEPLVVSRLVAQVELAKELRHLEMRLIKEGSGSNGSFRREVLVDRRKVRLMDMVGQVRVVLFLPSDVEMITSSPAKRRRYLDITLCQLDGVYCRTLSAYNKVLEQRNAALKKVAETGRGQEVLQIFTEKLVQQGSEIFARRAQFMGQLAQEAQRIHYEFLTGGRETIRLNYLPRLQVTPLVRDDDDDALDEFALTADWLEAQRDQEVIIERFTAALAECREKELGSGFTLVGPHRDDWRFWVNGRSLSSYGSRGQQRSAILALKMGEINLMKRLTGELPILLLDEVVAELDEQRRGLLLEYVQNGAQVLLTATDPDMFTSTFIRSANLMSVKSGRVQQQAEWQPGRV